MFWRRTAVLLLDYFPLRAYIRLVEGTELVAAVAGWNICFPCTTGAHATRAPAQGGTFRAVSVSSRGYWADLCFTDIMGGRVPCAPAGGLYSWPLEPESFLGSSDFVVRGGREGGRDTGAWMQCGCCNVRRRHLGGWRGGLISGSSGRAVICMLVCCVYIFLTDAQRSCFMGLGRVLKSRVLEVIEMAFDGQCRQTFCAALYIYTLCSLLCVFGITSESVSVKCSIGRPPVQPTTQPRGEFNASLRGTVRWRSVKLP